MKMKVFLCPEYIRMDSVKYGSPTLWRILKKHGIELEEMRWGGTLDSLDSLPKDEPVLVRGSSVMDCPWSELVQCCKKSGHLLFYEKRILCPASVFTPKEIREVLNNWLKKNKFIQ